MNKAVVSFIVGGAILAAADAGAAVVSPDLRARLGLREAAGVTQFQAEPAAIADDFEGEPVASVALATAFDFISDASPQSALLEGNRLGRLKLENSALRVLNLSETEEGSDAEFEAFSSSSEEEPGILENPIPGAFPLMAAGIAGLLGAAARRRNAR